MIDRIGGDEGSNVPRIATMQFVDHHLEEREFGILHQRRAHSMQSPALCGIGHSNYGPIPHALALTHCELVKYAGYWNCGPTLLGVFNRLET